MSDGPRDPNLTAAVSSLVVGLDCGLAEGNHGFGLNVEFVDVAAYKVYATHPDHVEVITKFIKPILKPGSRTAVQFPLQNKL